MQEQPRARTPDASGVVDRDGVQVAWESFGEGPTTVLLMPTWTIIPSRYWRLQVAYLARHVRVLTFDGRGSGASSRPAGAPAYADAEYAADALAVLDATATDKAVLVGLSCGVSWCVHLAAAHPERVAGLFAIAPSCGLDVPQPHRRAPWNGAPTGTEGWATYNRQHWLEGDFAAFREFFFQQMFSEPHSSKPIEDCVAWSADVTPQTLVDTVDGRVGCQGAVCQPIEPLLAELRCEVAVVHGTDDHVRTHAIGERLAELTGGSLTLLEGSGHGPNVRDPVRVNLLLREFVDRVCPPRPARSLWVRASKRPRRALYLCSPIGLGHVRRDLAIVEELRRLQPDLQIDWLSQPPVTAVLQAAGERVHPASRWLAAETDHVEAEAGEHDLHAFQAIRRMDEVLVGNFMVFDEVTTETPYDLVVADEAWEVDHLLHENPERKRAPYAWMTDFVGWLPMPSGGGREAALTADYNAEMLEQRARYRHVRDRSVFIGEPEDVVTDPFGPGLPGIREWTTANFDFAGYVTGTPTSTAKTNEALRAALGYGPRDVLVVVAVGGSAVGAPLLRRVLDAVPLARRERPELTFLVVTGPRINPASLPTTPGARIVGYVPDLADHLAACDVAIVQGGLSTCMELTAAGTPFVFVPLENHFEQNLHVRHRLERYGAGQHLSYAEAKQPELLVKALLAALDTSVATLPVRPGGAARAAAMLADLM